MPFFSPPPIVAFCVSGFLPQFNSLASQTFAGAGAVPWNSTGVPRTLTLASLFGPLGRTTLALPPVVSRVQLGMDSFCKHNVPLRKPPKAVFSAHLLQQTTFNSNKPGLARNFDPLCRLMLMNLLAQVSRGSFYSHPCTLRAGYLALLQGLQWLR